MLVFGLHILFQKESYGLSIFVAIITALAFAILSVPVILVLARFIPGLPVGLTFNNKFLNANSQLVIYTFLIVTYFVHVINSLKLKNKNEEYLQYASDTGKASDESNENLEINENLHNDSEVEYNITKDDDEKLVFTADESKDSAYDTEDVMLVEDLTDEDINFMKDEEKDG